MSRSIVAAAQARVLKCERRALAAVQEWHLHEIGVKRDAARTPENLRFAMEREQNRLLHARAALERAKLRARVIKGEIR